MSDSRISVNEYVDMTPLLNMSSLDMLHKQICFGLLEAEVNYSHAGEPLDDVKRRAKGFWDSDWEAKLNLDLDTKARFDALEPKSKRKFACYYDGLYSLMSVLVVNQTTHQTRHDPRFTPKHPINYPLFQPLISWIEQQNVFASFGRVIIFLSPPGFKTVPHRDGNDIQGYEEEFIWLSPNRAKRLSLIDHQTGERRELKSPALWFNSNQLHSIESDLNHTYAVRIDGKFNERVRKYLAARFVKL